MLEILLLLAAVAGPGEASDSLVADAETLIRRGQPDRAADLIRRRVRGPDAGALAQEPRLWKVLARASRLAGDFESAAEEYSAAFRLGKDLADALCATECYLEMKNAEAAEEMLRRCGSPQEPEARAAVDELRGLCLFLKNREEEARPYLERARAAGRLGPSHYLGLAKFHRGEHAEAIRFFDEAIRFQPDDYYSLLYRAWAFLELNRLDDARKALAETRAVASTPEVEEISGRVELRAERFEEAADRFRKALEANPGYAEAQSGLATALRRLGRTEEAKAAAADFRKLFQAQQENLRIAYTLSQRHLASPRDPAIAEELGRHYLATADFQESERYAWKVLAIDPARISARLLLARSLAATGRYQHAAFHYRKILREAADCAEARSELEDLIRKHARRSPRTDG